MKIVTDKFGNKKYYNKKNQLHREDGPAVEYYIGDKVWYLNGEIHRLDGAAFETENGFKEWYYKGKSIPVSSQEEFERYIKLLAFI